MSSPPQENPGMEPQRQEPNTFLAGAILIAAVLVLVPTIFLFWVYNRDHRQCVALPNGLYLGYAAVFDFAKDPFSVGGTIKFADGTPIVDGDVWSILVSDTSAFGYMENNENLENFAWRADTGVVLYRDDPRTHDRIVAEAGPLNHGADESSFGRHVPPSGQDDSPRRGPVSYGPTLLMDILADMPQFEIERCRTRLFRF